MDKNRFNIGDVVIPRWSPTKELFLNEVIRFDGSYVVCKPLGQPDNRSYHYLPSEIEVDKALSRDNKLKKLCN